MKVDPRLSSGISPQFVNAYLHTFGWRFRHTVKLATLLPIKENIAQGSDYTPTIRPGNLDKFKQHRLLIV